MNCAKLTKLGRGQGLGEGTGESQTELDTVGELVCHQLERHGLVGVLPHVRAAFTFSSDIFSLAAVFAFCLFAMNCR